MSGESGSFSKNLSNQHLNFFTLHPLRSLMFLGSELNSFTNQTKKLSSLIVFSRVDVVRLKRRNLKERPFIPPFLLLKNIMLWYNCGYILIIILIQFGQISLIHINKSTRDIRYCQSQYDILSLPYESSGYFMEYDRIEKVVYIE